MRTKGIRLLALEFICIPGYSNVVLLFHVVNRVTDCLHRIGLGDDVVHVDAGNKSCPGPTELASQMTAIRLSHRLE